MNSISPVTAATASPVSSMSPATSTVSSTPIDNQSLEQYEALQISINDLFQPVFMSFYYKTYNDFQIYHITCKEISFYDCLNQNHDQPMNLHVFYYQQPVDKKIYQVICEVVSYNFIIAY